MSAMLVLAAIALFAASGVPGLFAGANQGWGAKLGAGLFALGSAAGLGGAGWTMGNGPSELWLPWQVPGGALALKVDGLSAMFIAPIALVSLMGTIYGLEYWPVSGSPGRGKPLRLVYGFMAAGLTLVAAAHNGILFLFGWELMALSAFFAVTSEDDKPATRDAGYVYLACTRIGTLCLFAAFALMHKVNGSFALEPLKGASPGVTTAIVVLALIGCGLKAGIMPLHVWLPGAHANAPSHVSALMSGVLIKIGIYGLVRILTLVVDPPPWTGSVLLALGALSGVLGVAFAIGQHDIKRLLAYHSIENIGIIVLGLGVAMVGRTTGHVELVVLGLAGALLHVWNHSLFKSLLFLSAGSVIHATGTREIDHLGGLLKKMPKTAFLFLVGAVAICGLPPLNGFVSELFVYLGLFRGVSELEGSAGISTALGVAALALIGGLALACFVKVFGSVFLGQSRSHHTEHAHDPGKAMVGPMIALALCCAGIGVAPWAVAPALDEAVRAFGVAGAPPLATLAPVKILSGTAGALAALVAGWTLFLRWRLARSTVTAAGTWDCGYLAPAARMQYTSSSFAEMLVGYFGWALRPKVHPPGVSGLFPSTTSFHSHVDDTVLDGAVRPSLRLVARVTTYVRSLQPPTVNWYLVYVLAALMAGLLWAQGVGQ